MSLVHILFDGIQNWLLAETLKVKVRIYVRMKIRRSRIFPDCLRIIVNITPSPLWTVRNNSVIPECAVIPEASRESRLRNS